MTNNAVTTRTERKPEIAAGGKITAMVPQNIDQAFRLAEALSKAGDMVPKAYQGKPMETMAAIMRGSEVGLAPMQALANIAVINGRASLWGDALPALMQRAGHHIDVEIEGDGDKAVARATLTRGDTGKTIVRTFSMADAKRAGLAGKQGPWQSYPLRMLSNRARAFAIRDGAADALMGMAIADEVSDYGPDKARDVTPQAPKRGGVVYADPEPDEIHEGETARDSEILDAEEDSGDPAEWDAARAEARKGRTAFLAWWNGDGLASREIVRPILAELQQTAAQAEADAARVNDDDPLADITPTPEDLARAEAEAQAEIERGWNEGKDAAE